MRHLARKPEFCIRLLRGAAGELVRLPLNPPTAAWRLLRHDNPAQRERYPRRRSEARPDRPMRHEVKTTPLSPPGVSIVALTMRRLER